MDVHDFAKLWENDVADLAEMQKIWDLRADDFNDRSNDKEGNKRQTQIMSLLTSRGMLSDNAEILDIGCGPGKYALEFAKSAKQVTGIDISPKMLQHAKNNAAQQNRDNTVFELAAWEPLNLLDHGWIKKFDLVFASMCPAINCSDSLLKMCEASKGACFISGFVQRQDKLRDELHKVIYGNYPENRWRTNMYYALNILWLSGYFPEITYYDDEFEHIWPLEKTVAIYSHQLKKKNMPDSDLAKQVEEYLQTKADNGMIRERVQAKIAWVCWKV